MVFCLVAKSLSFSKAAQNLGISRSLVSKRVSRLEERLDTRLIQRSTRAMSLTEAGTLLFERYADITERIERAEREVADLNRAHSGLIRLAAPSVFGYAGVPLIADLHRQFPNIEVQVSVEDDGVDVIQSGYDAAIHIGALRDSNLICRKIASTPLVVCASPSYLATRGVPLTPSDLRRHNCLTLTPRSSEEKCWQFAEHGDVPFSVAVRGDFHSNSELVLKRAAVSGMGLCQLPRALVEESLDSERLECVLETYSHVTTDVYVVLPHRDVPEKVRVAIDFLTAEVQRRWGAET